MYPVVACVAYVSEVEASSPQSHPLALRQVQELGHRLVYPGLQDAGCGGRTADGNAVCWERSGCLSQEHRPDP